MEEQPFYELDDEELIIAEADHARFPPDAAAARIVRESRPVPGSSIVLRSRLDDLSLQRLERRFSAAASPLTIFDHALFLNACACVLDLAGTDAYGLDAMLRIDSTELALDRERPLHAPRASSSGFGAGVLRRLIAAPAQVCDQSALRLEAPRNELAALSSLTTEEPQFFAIRRFTLALLPRITRREKTADTLRDYAMSMRVMITSLRAQLPLLGWPAVTARHDTQASQLLHTLLGELRHEVT